MQAPNEDVRGEGVTGLRAAPHLPPVLRVIRGSLSSVSTVAVTLSRTIVNLSLRVRSDPDANPAALGGHQFWGDEE